MTEEEIRPVKLFNRYLELADEDIATFFNDRSRFSTVPCPACRNTKSQHEFTKKEFYYASCTNCGTLYLNPRPSIELIDRYYKDSKAVEFWSNHFFKETAEARRVKMFKPRAELVSGLAEKLKLRGTCVDIGPGYGIFMEEMAKLNHFTNIVGIEPSPHLAEDCRAKGFEIIEAAIEDVPDCDLKCQMAVNFEVLEHVYSPIDFLKAIHSILATNGILLLTTLTVSGFDIQELWSHSKSVHPPHHINLMSIAGLKELFKIAGFEILELTTPGKLDVHIVENMIKENPGIPLSHFSKQLVLQSDEVKQNFQHFLSSNQLSSHVQVVARRNLE